MVFVVYSNCFCWSSMVIFAFSISVFLSHYLPVGLLSNYGNEKKRTLSFCLTMDLNHRKSMTILKLCKKTSKCDVAGHCSFICLEMAMVWRVLISIFFPMSNFSLFVFFSDAAQDCLGYLLSMSKLKSFKFSLKWDQEQISDSMHLIFKLE